MIKAILFALLFSVPAFADDDYGNDDDGYDRPPDPRYYSCQLNYEVEKRANFKKKWQAEDWCEALGYTDSDDSCRVIRGEYRGWDAVFSESAVLKYESDESYARSRKILVTYLYDLIEQKGYYKSGFSVSTWYDKCWDDS